MAAPKDSALVRSRAEEVAAWQRHLRARIVLRRVVLDDHVVWTAEDDVGVCAMAQDEATLAELVRH